MRAGGQGFAVRFEKGAHGSVRSCVMVSRPKPSGTTDGVEIGDTQEVALSDNTWLPRLGEVEEQGGVGVGGRGEAGSTHGDGAARSHAASGMVVIDADLARGGEYTGEVKEVEEDKKRRLENAFHEMDKENRSEGLAVSNRDRTVHGARKAEVEDGEIETVDGRESKSGVVGVVGEAGTRGLAETGRAEEGGAAKIVGGGVLEVKNVGSSAINSPFSTPLRGGRGESVSIPNDMCRIKSNSVAQATEEQGHLSCLVTRF